MDNVEKVDVLDALYFFRTENDDRYKEALKGYVAKEAGKGLSSNDFTDAEKAKLDGIDLTGYVAKEAGKGLSTNDFTDDEKAKLDGINLSDYVAKEAGKGLSSNDFTDAEKAKLDGINLTDYVAKEAGKGLSSNDFTDDEKNKLAGIDLTDYVAKEAGKGLSSNDFTNDEKNKLDGINLSGYVAKEAGKGLSTNDFTDAEKSKLAGLSNYTLPSAASNVLGGVKVGSNITNSNGTISLTKDNVTSALGYTPPTTNTTYNEATTSAAGLMSASDKTKLNGLSNYTLPSASNNVLGGVKVGSNITNSNGTISLTKDNVTSALGYTPPSTNTTYNEATTSAAGLMSANDKTKLNGVANSAQVNVIESVKVNNTALKVTDKTVNVDLSGYLTTSAKAASATTADSVNKSVTGTNAADLLYAQMADNDYFRLRVGGTASNAGYVELATADDSNEPIYIRQYSGVFQTLTRTATLLDASGNTSFPGKVTANSFSGNLTGTATNVTGVVAIANGGTGTTNLANITVGGASKDANGNVIATTYATKTELATYATKTELADYATKADVDAKLNAVRYGYRIKKSEPDPFKRVEYIFDAAGAIPAKMNYESGEFDYGSWQSVWFVRDNKPCMLKSDGTVDYYLNPNDYTKKEDDTASDIANDAYDGNAMAAIPLCWVKRYEDDDYYYEIVSNVKYDDDYYAFAHTNASGEIMPFCYHSIYEASGSSSKLRSLSGKAPAVNMGVSDMANGATANGSRWYIDYWSLWELLRTLSVLISKSTDSQAAFGIGVANASSNANTGSLDDKGQFFGYNDMTHSMKLFHIENIYNNTQAKCAGFMSNRGVYYVKMTPEGSGYRISDTNGYTNCGNSFAKTINFVHIKDVTCNKFGMLPLATSGSTSTYFCDSASDFSVQNNVLEYMIRGGNRTSNTLQAGMFNINLASKHDKTHDYTGSMLTYV